MINELLMQKDYEETNKMLKAIHRQAKDAYYFEKGRKYLESLEEKRQQKKEFKEYLLNDLFNFVLFLIFAIPTILLLVVLCY